MDEFENVPRAVNCWVIPTAMLELAGVTVSDTSVGTGVLLDPPPELPQLVSSMMIRKKRSILFDFVNLNSLRDQCRHISAALQVPHVPPCLHDYAVCFHLL